MKAVLRIAWSYFWLVPLQRWLNGIGLALISVGVVQLLLGVLGSHSRTLQLSSVFALLGVAIIGFAPAFAGGAMLRLASKPSLLHLRPHGRLCAILGTTLAITLLAALITTPVVIDHVIAHILNAGRSGISPFSEVMPLQLFCVAWSSIALVWCGLFFAINIPLLYFFMLAAIPPVLNFGRPLLSIPSNLALLFAFSVGTWLAFSNWYLKVRTIRQPVWTPGFSPSGSSYPIDRFATAAAAFADRLLNTRSNDMTIARAQRFYLLGSATPLAQVTIGILLTLVGTAAWILIPDRNAPHQAPAFWNLLFSGVPPSMGFMIVRRARLLWLRAGHDRAGLFAMAERMGLTAVATFLIILTLGFLGIALTSRPDQAAALLLFTMEQWAFAGLLFYAGLSVTRGWDAAGVLLTVGLFVIFLAQVIAIQPRQETSIKVVAAALLLLLPLVYLLRCHARRRWLRLDWRIAQLPKMLGRA